MKIHTKYNERNQTEVEIKSRYTKMAGKLNDNVNGDSDNNDTWIIVTMTALKLMMYLLMDLNCRKPRV